MLLLVPSAALPCQCGDMPEDLYAAVFEGRVERISRIEPRWRYMRRGAVLALYDWLNSRLRGRAQRLANQISQRRRAFHLENERPAPRRDCPRDLRRK